jgi:hypothetical protein
MLPHNQAHNLLEADSDNETQDILNSFLSALSISR